MNKFLTVLVAVSFGCVVGFFAGFLLGEHRATAQTQTQAQLSNNIRCHVGPTRPGC
jgi:hypothetical protein